VLLHHGERCLALGTTSRSDGVRIHNKAMLVPGQSVANLTEPCRGISALAVELRLRLARDCVRVVDNLTVSRGGSSCGTP
jgi:hypothetical protein